MQITKLLPFAGLISSCLAVQGFNYGAVQRTGAIKNQADFQAEFSTAKGLAGTNGAFSSARLYTTIQAGTANSPISAIPAAIAADTSLLLGMWASAGQGNIDNEIQALLAAINTYGTAFTSRVTGLSVGSEDLYRITPTGLANDPNSVGAGPDVLVRYINQVRSALSQTALRSVPIGHVDTWTAWVNGSNAAVVQACDWIGMNTFPYFQTTDANSIDNAGNLFRNAYQVTQNAAAGKPVWITETGWPVGGKNSAQAVASRENAKRYWDEVGCRLFGSGVNTYWYTLVDANTDTSGQPQFGVVGTSLTTTPLFDLTCPSNASPTSSSPSSSTTTTRPAAQTSTSLSVATSIVTTVSGSVTAPTEATFSILPIPSSSSRSIATSLVTTVTGSVTATVIRPSTSSFSIATSLVTTVTGSVTAPTQPVTSIRTTSTVAATPVTSTTSAPVFTGGAVVRGPVAGGVVGAALAVVALI